MQNTYVATAQRRRAQTSQFSAPREKRLRRVGDHTFAACYGHTGMPMSCSICGFHAILRFLECRATDVQHPALVKGSNSQDHTA